MINAKRLCDIVDSFKNARVAVFGDLILDEYVWGSVDRVSPEAPVVVVDVQSESSVLLAGQVIYVRLSEMTLLAR